MVSTPYFWIFIGGGLGSICRYALSAWIAGFKFTFPLGTFAANVLASFLLGFVLGAGLRYTLPEPLRWLLISGFCGGFSTFSTFSGETWQLWSQGNTSLAVLNITANVLSCLVAVYVGLRMSGG
ncbi:MAG: fluoride efflux transporter CrcB [Saprospiraceae bacterium]|nr:fluoride efflux transporter CrcB [Saprospiraceae bacterium]